jgi:hypothetical protein
MGLLVQGENELLIILFSYGDEPGKRLHKVKSGVAVQGLVFICAVTLSNVPRDTAKQSDRLNNMSNNESPPRSRIAPQILRKLSQEI